MSKKQTYNGWKNYETWNVKLWIDNEQGSYEYWNEIAREVWEESETREPEYEGQTRAQGFLYDFSQRMKEEFETAKDDILEQQKLTCSTWADLLGAALSEVDWYEIAESYLSDLTIGALAEADSKEAE